MAGRSLACRDVRVFGVDRHSIINVSCIRQQGGEIGREQAVRLRKTAERGERERKGRWMDWSDERLGVLGLIEFMVINSNARLAVN